MGHLDSGVGDVSLTSKRRCQVGGEISSEG